MKTFVVNLARDIERRRHMESQLHALGLPYRFHRATFGRSLTPAVIAEVYLDRWARLFRSRSLTLSEIGCALSHIDVYRKIISEDIGCALILEDDTLLPDDLAELLLQLETVVVPDRPEVYLLSPAMGCQEAMGKRLSGSNSRILEYRDGFYASSYVVTRAAAQALLRELHPVRDVADCWARIAPYGVVDIYALDPPVVFQDQASFGSSTTSDIVAATAPGLGPRLAYLARRLVAILFGAGYTLWRKLNAGM